MPCVAPSPKNSDGTVSELEVAIHGQCDAGRDATGQLSATVSARCRLDPFALTGHALRDPTRFSPAARPGNVIAEGHWKPAGGEQIKRIHDLDMKVRLRGIARVATGGDRLPRADPVTGLHPR